MKTHYLPVQSLVRVSPTAPNVTRNYTLNSVSNSVMNAATTSNLALLASSAKSVTMHRGDSHVIPPRTTRFSLLFTPLWSVFCAALCSAVFTSCSATQIDLEAITTPPESVTITNDLVTIPQGIAVAVRVRTDASMDPESSDTYISMTSANPDVIRVWPTTRESIFVLGGASQGVAAFSVSIRDETSHTFTATVVPNPNANNSSNDESDENTNGNRPADNQTPDENASNSQTLTQPVTPYTQP